VKARYLAVMTAAALCSCADRSGSGDLDDRAGDVPPADHVAVYLTTHDLAQTLARQPDLVFSEGDMAAAGATIAVDPAQTFQTLSAGFGVALTDTSAWLLQVVLPPAMRDRAMADLFSPTDGIGLTYLRVGLGGTDYNVAETPYTYDDLPAGETDPQLAHFSIDHDRAYIIPAVQQALRLNPDIVMTTSPWSPPAWMKTDGQLVPKTPLSTLKRDAFEPWAQYFVRFVKEYEAAGIHFDHVSIQNEPLNPVLVPLAGRDGFIPGLLLPPTDAIELITNHLAPAFRANAIDSKITIWDFFWEVDASYIPLVMAGAGGDVGALAYHCYLSDPRIMDVYATLYGLPQYETECSSKLSNVEPAQMTIRALNHSAEGIQLWNAALDPDGGPKFGGGCRGQPGTSFAGDECTAPIVVDPATGTYTRDADFWALAHFSKFIKRGAHRIAASGLQSCGTSPATRPGDCGLEGTAFENPDGSRVLVLTSNDGSEAQFTMTEGGRSVRYAVPDRAIATLVWQAP